MSRAGWLFLALGVCLACAPSQALADGPWLTEVSATTELPLSAGARVGFETPSRGWFGLSAGFVPGGYVDVINSVVVGLGGYDEDVAEVIELTLDDSLVLRLDAGWRPSPRAGLYIQGGYRFVRMGGIVDGVEMEALVGSARPAPDRRYTYDITSSLHMLEAEVGWHWTLPAGLSIKAGAGFAGTFFASTEAEAKGVIDQFHTQIEDFLDTTFTSFAFTPLMTLSVGWQFK